MLIVTLLSINALIQYTKHVLCVVMCTSSGLGEVFSMFNQRNQDMEKSVNLTQDVQWQPTPKILKALI